jgi:hypothetical protein
MILVIHEAQGSSKDSSRRRRTREEGSKAQLLDEVAHPTQDNPDWNTNTKANLEYKKSVDIHVMHMLICTRLELHL